MAHVIGIKGGGYATIFSLEDLLGLVETHMGTEVCDTFGEMLSDKYADDAEWETIEAEHRRELDEIRGHYHNVILSLRNESEQLAELIRAPRLDRKKISSLAGRIGIITWREL